MSLSGYAMHEAEKLRHLEEGRRRVADSGIDTISVKLGTNSLYKEGKNSVRVRRRNWSRVASSILQEQAHGRGVVIVSSGAIAAGRRASGESVDVARYFELESAERKLSDVEEREKEALRVLQQSLASEGQHVLMYEWRKRLGRVGQVLVTRTELGEEQASARTMKVIEENLGRGVASVLNENNTISHAELSFGDNDMLQAANGVDMQRCRRFGNVAALFLTDTNGLYEDRTRADSRIAEITVDDMSGFIQDGTNGHSRGGMTSKAAAAAELLEEGVAVWIGPSYANDSIQRIMQGELGTLVLPSLAEVGVVEASADHS